MDLYITEGEIGGIKCWTGKRLAAALQSGLNFPGRIYWHRRKRALKHVHDEESEYKLGDIDTSFSLGVC